MRISALIPVLFVADISPVALSFSSIADAANASGRLYGVFEAELLDGTRDIDEDLDSAIEVKGATFTWDAPPPQIEDVKSKTKTGQQKMAEHLHPNKAKAKALETKNNKQIALDEKAKVDEENVFKIRDVTMSIPKGKLVAIVGSVGSGKTSLLQGIIGEMRKVQGSIVFSGSVGYCPQSAWIQASDMQLFIPCQDTEFNI